MIHFITFHIIIVVSVIYVIYLTGATKEMSVRLSTLVISNEVSKGASLYQTVNQDISEDVNKYEDSTMIYLPTNNDLFTNNFLINLFQVIVSLVGVFVFFFVACVVTYIYIKCFRQTTGGKRLNSNQCESEYKSLSSMERVEYDSPLHPEPHVNLDLTYLTPVLRSIEKRETSSLAENNILADIQTQRHATSSQPTNEHTPTTDNLQNHVYIEIVEDKIESSRVHDDPDSETLCIKNNRKSS